MMPTLFQTWLERREQLLIHIEIRQSQKAVAQNQHGDYIAQYIDDNGVLQTKTKTGTAGTWA